MKLALLEIPKTGFLATRPIWCLLFLLPLCVLGVELALCFVTLSALCSFAITLVKKREMIVLLHLYTCCLLAVSVPWVLSQVCYCDILSHIYLFAMSRLITVKTCRQKYNK